MNNSPQSNGNIYKLRSILDATIDGVSAKSSVALIKASVAHSKPQLDEVAKQLRSGHLLLITRDRVKSILQELENHDHET